MIVYKTEKFDIDYELSKSKRFLPLNMQIDLTHTCDSNCPFCLQGSSESRTDCMNTDTIFSILTELKKLGCFRIGFSGGEPFCRNDIMDILEYATRLGFSISITTNAHLITDNDIERLVDLNLSKVTISLHTVDPQKYKFIFGRQDLNVEDTLEKIRKMTKRGITVGIASTLTKYNIDDVDTLVNSVVSCGVSQWDINFNPLLPGKKEVSALVPSEIQLQNLYNKVGPGVSQAQIRSGYNSHENELPSILCVAGKYSCNIRYNGDVYPCSLFDCCAGNIFEQSFTEIWENAPIFLLLRSITHEHFSKTCSECKAKDTCRMCLWNNIVRNKNIFLPYKQTCDYSHLLTKIIEKE